MADLIVQSKVRAYIKKKGLNTGGATMGALDKALGRLIEDAAGRAKGNDRKTLMAKDV